MAYQRIPLTTDANQKFTCTLGIDGKNKKMSFFIAYNSMAGHWMMDLTDAVTDTALLSSIPLLPGEPPADNILEQYSYLKIGSAYLVNTGKNSSSIPTANNLGTEWILLWGDTPA
jgi:hypothetical protein